MGTGWLRVLGLLLAAGAAARGAVTTDGSLPGTSGRALSGPNFVIPQQLGADRLGLKVGANLFHSFQELNLATGESATFTELQDVENVIARVTGGPSSIDGKISCAANLFLLNPQGLMFKENATLDVTGSFTATTANFLRLGGDGRFAAALGDESALTSSPVSAFGFTGTPAAISATGSNLAAPQGRSLQLVGGGINLSGAQLTAPGGKIALASAAGPGELGPDFKPLRRMGAVNITGGSRVDTSGEQGGALVIRGGQLAVLNSRVASTTTGAGRGGKMDVRVRGSAMVGFNGRIVTTTSGAGQAGDVDVRALRLEIGFNSVVGSQATSTASATARAGRVQVRAGDLAIHSESSISGSTFGLGQGSLVDVNARALSIRGDSSPIATGIFSNTNASGAGGAGGSVRVQADAIRLAQGGIISTDTRGLGTGGDVTVAADGIVIDGGGSTNKTGIFGDTISQGAGGPGGDVNVRAGRLDIVKGGLISTKTLGLGAGGNTVVQAQVLTIARQGSALFTGIAADSPLGGLRGPAGDVRVAADFIQLLGGGQISSNTFGLGRGGNVSVTATDILMTGAGRVFSNISADSVSKEAGGRGGDVRVETQTLQLLGGARISANTFGRGDGGDVLVLAEKGTFNLGDSVAFTGVSAESASLNEPGRGGSVRVEIGRLALLGGAGIIANTQGPGLGGDIAVRSDTLSLFGGSRISAETFSTGRGGSIVLEAGDLGIGGRRGLEVSGIFSGSRATGIGGPGGRMEISAGTLRLSDGGSIAATSSSTGPGGSVRIVANEARLGSGATIEASATGPGVAGSVALAVRQPLLMEGGSAVRTASAVSSAGTVEISSATDIFMRDSSASVRATQGDAGTLTVNAVRMLKLENSSLIAEAGRNGGNISIDPQFVVLDRSLISANAILGAGGNILIVADSFLASRSSITASSEASVQGTVQINSPEADFAGSLVPLTGGLLDASSQLREQCARRLGLDFSSLLVLGRGGVPPSPADPLTSGNAAPP